METPACPICGGTSGHLGQMGPLDWYRCLHCGMTFNHQQEEDDNEDD